MNNQKEYKVASVWVSRERIQEFLSAAALFLFISWDRKKQLASEFDVSITYEGPAEGKGPEYWFTIEGEGYIALEIKAFVDTLKGLGIITHYDAKTITR